MGTYYSYSGTNKFEDTDIGELGLNATEKDEGSSLQSCLLKQPSSTTQRYCLLHSVSNSVNFCTIKQLN